MSVKPIDILGGESVYCINEDQLKKSYQMAYDDPETSEKIQAGVADLEAKFSRNERAALAFVVIDRLLKNQDH